MNLAASSQKIPSAASRSIKVHEKICLCGYEIVTGDRGAAATTIRVEIALIPAFAAV